MQSFEIALLVIGSLVAGSTSAIYINGDFSAHVDALRNYSETQRNAMAEKLAVTHYEKNGDDYLFIISNYGKYSITITDVLDGELESLNCTFTNTLEENTQGHIICNNVSSPQGIFVSTSNGNIIEIVSDT